MNKGKTMLFIKGTPSIPKCKFTVQLFQILNNYPSLQFEYFNILENQTVRTKLKEFSQWPTYPQIYFKGKLIGKIKNLNNFQGGVDILETLHETNELKSYFDS